jgi:hypothetical protein
MGMPLGEEEVDQVRAVGRAGEGWQRRESGAGREREDPIEERAVLLQQRAALRLRDEGVGILQIPRGGRDHERGRAGEEGSERQGRGGGARGGCQGEEREDVEGQERGRDQTHQESASTVAHVAAPLAVGEEVSPV